MKNKLLLILFILGTLPVFAQNPEITVPLRFDHYYSYDEVVQALKALNKSFPEMTKLDLVGHSEENRAIYCLTINNPATGSEQDKPGVYVDGNIHGNEIQAGEVCMYLANTLLTKYKNNEKIKKVVDKNAFYILPVVNVDGRYHFFTDANTPSSNRGLRRPKDDDRDGLFDEDFSDDLNGDGNITTMRKKDPNGEYKEDPEDPRILVRVKPGEKGKWTILGQEGIDNDGDGQINEDSEGYVDGNRNWPYSWEPNYVQRGSGYYPLSGTGTKAIAEYILARPNIIIVWAFHNSGGMILRGPSLKSEGEFSQQDLAVYDYLGENSEHIIPGYEYLIGWKDLYSTYGDFTGFTNNIHGTYSFVGELFQSETQTYGPPKKEEPDEEGVGRFRSDPARDREELKFNDHVALGELYKPWTKYNHPTYGEIEIGGWVKMSNRLPHPFMLPDLVHRNASAVIFSAEQTPEVKMEVIEKKDLGNNLYRVRVRLSNTKAIPSISAQTVKNKLYPKDILKVTSSGGEVVAGGQLTNEYTDKVSYKEHKPEIQLIQVPGFGKVDYQFLISGKGKVTIQYESRKAGKLSETISL